MTTTTQSDVALPWEGDNELAAQPKWHLSIAWYLDAPERIGEVAVVGERSVLGRGAETPEDGAPRLRFARVRPGWTSPTEPLESSRISRLQLKLTASPSGIEVERVGRCAMLHNGRELDRAVLREGDVLTLRNALVLLVVRRPQAHPPLETYPVNRMGAFGQADPFGFVGESPAIWELRDQLAFAAGTSHHVLLLGESGVGKELAARAVHELSARSARPLIARNAATFPEGLVDAELFGTVKNYPNPGVPDRKGVIGEAHGSTLFLDEIGELPPHLQAHLLRVLDQRGEYQRLGEARARESDFRLIAATNRPLESLKPDFIARFTLLRWLPGLEQRREDIPLLIAHLLRSALRENQALLERFFEAGPAEAAVVRVEPGLVERLLGHEYRSHVRELKRLLWMAASSSSGRYIALTDAVRAELEREPEAKVSQEPTRLQLDAALQRAGGSVTRAARLLGLKNRYVLYRLLRKHELKIGDDDDETPSSPSG